MYTCNLLQHAFQCCRRMISTHREYHLYIATAGMTLPLHHMTLAAVCVEEMGGGTPAIQHRGGGRGKPHTPADMQSARRHAKNIKITLSFVHVRNLRIPFARQICHCFSNTCHMRFPNFSKNLSIF